MEDINKRVSEYCAKTDIKETLFYSEIGIESADALINNVSAMRIVAKRYPDLNRNWLLSGKGEMINSQFINKKRTSMSSRERFTELLNELGRRKIVTSQKELAEKLNYNKSYFSHLVNNRVLTNDLYVKLSELIPDLNIEYLESGFGSLLISQEKDTSAAEIKTEKKVESSNSEQDILFKQIESLSEEIAEHGRELKRQGDRIDDLLGLIKIVAQRK